MKYYNYPNGTKTAEALDSENTSVVKGPDGKYLVPNELPAITANDKGKIVRVKVDGSGIEYTGEAELPPITSADGGKVCKVKSDHSGVEWGEAGSSDNTFPVKLTVMPGIGNSLDKTIAEIYTAFAAGKFPYVYYPTNGQILPAVQINSAVAMFQCITNSSGTALRVVTVLANLNGVEYNTVDYALTPPSTN